MLYEIKKVQAQYYLTGGPVTRFFEYDRDSASTDDEKRIGSFGWKALCYCIGHPVETSILSPYLQAFQKLTDEERDRPMEGQLTPSFSANKRRRAAFERYKQVTMDSAEVYIPLDGEDESFDTVFHKLRKRSLAAIDVS